MRQALPLIVAVTVFATWVAIVPTPRLAARSQTRFDVRAATERLLGPVVRSRRNAREASAVADDLPDLVDLLAVAAAAGASVQRACEIAARRHSGAASAILTAAVARTQGGQRLGDALPAGLAAQPTPVADAARALVAVLVDSDRYGTALAPALERLSADLRTHRRHRAEARARRVPVRLVVPLVLCVLPAFALLTVAPLLAGVARDALAESPSPPLELPKELP